MSERKTILRIAFPLPVEMLCESIEAISNHFERKGWTDICMSEDESSPRHVNICIIDGIPPTANHHQT